MTRRLATLLAASVSALALLVGAPAPSATAAAASAPDDYRIISTKLGDITENGLRIPVTVTLVCPAGTTAPLTVTISGVRVDIAGYYETGSAISQGRARFSDAPYEDGLQRITCTGARQTVVGIFETHWTPLTSIFFRPTKHVQLSTTLGAVTTNQQANLTLANANRITDYSISNIKVGRISADRTFAPIQFTYTCPAGSSAYILAVARNVNWESQSFPGQVLTGGFLAGLGTVNCTGRKQVFEGRFSPPTAMIQYRGYLLDSPAVQLAVQVGPLVTEQVFNVR